MKHSFLFPFFLLALLIVLPGCRCPRYLNWFAEAFNQGTPLSEYTIIPGKYLRSIRVYDQFTTLGIFDAILLSDEVVSTFAKAYALRHCYSPEKFRRLESNLIEENDRYITFYLIAYYPHMEHCSLNAEDSIWTLRLEVGGECFAPLEIKPMEFDPEYAAFFGKRYTIFRKSYRVRFNANDVENVPILNDACQIKLVFRRVGFEEKMVWDWDWQGCIVEPCHLGDDTLLYDLDCRKVC